MNSDILNTEVQDFISKFLDTDITKLILKGSPFDRVNIQELVEQIEAKRKCKTKLPTWYNTTGIYYPNKLNIEQTSSEITAAYKSNLVSGKSMIDLTGGFGVDVFYFSKRIDNVTHCEINVELSEIVTHNLNQLDVNNVNTIAEDGVAFIQDCNLQFDWIYIDPSRRHDVKGKVFMLKDCVPNVPEHLYGLFKHSDHILIKTSPLLDISLGLSELAYVKEVHVVAAHNEVKELLWLLQKGHSEDLKITTINIKKNASESFSFFKSEESKGPIDTSLPLNYLYEPNAAIMKSGGFNSIGAQLNIKKLHKHSHLYTSNEPIEFPGRTFKIDAIYPYNKKVIKSLGIQQANITTRNFPESVSNLRKKYKIKDGGSKYLFFTTNHLEDRIVLSCSKLN